MNEKLYPEFHIDELKRIFRGLALNQPRIERICLFKPVSAAALPISEGQRENRKDKYDDNPNNGHDMHDQAAQPALPTTPSIPNGVLTDLTQVLANEAGSAAPSSTPMVPLYCVVIVGSDELDPLVEDLNFRLQLEWGERSLSGELAKCFTEPPEERAVKDSWMFRQILPEDYEDGSWAYEDNGYIDEDGNEIPTKPVYFEDPGSELVLFERETISEGKLSQIATENLSASDKVIQYAKEMYEYGNPLSAKDFKPGANKVISTIAKDQNVAPDTLRKYVSDTGFYFKSSRGRPPKV